MILQTKEPIEQEAAVENYPIREILDLTGSGPVLKNIEYVPGDFSSITEAFLSNRIDSQRTSKLSAKKSRRNPKPDANTVAAKAALIDKISRELGVLTSDGKS